MICENIILTQSNKLMHYTIRDKILFFVSFIEF